MSYGKWLAGELARRRISQRSLAVRAGIDHSTISRIVRTDVDPLVSTAVRIAGIVGWPTLEALYSPTGANRNHFPDGSINGPTDRPEGVTLTELPPAA